MRRLLIAVRAFFLVLFNGAVAARVDLALRPGNEPALAPSVGDGRAKGPAKAGEPAPAAAAPKPSRPGRSDALSLLAALQREGRLIDFLKEPLGDYDDAQIGAVARDLHRDCGRVIERLFAVQPLVSAPEGSAIDVPAGYDAARYRLVGRTCVPPARGALVHAGWIATKCETPVWTGGEASLWVISPAEVEVS